MCVFEEKYHVRVCLRNCNFVITANGKVTDSSGMYVFVLTNLQICRIEPTYLKVLNGRRIRPV